MKALPAFLAFMLLALPEALFPSMLQEISIGADARAAAMGNAFAPITEGNRSVNLNPAGLAKTKGLMTGASFNRWLLDTSLQEINLAMPAGNGAWGADIIFVNMGEFEILDDYGYPTGATARPFTLQITGAYGLPVLSYFENISNSVPSFLMMLGFSGKYIIRNIDNEIVQAFSLDAGVNMEFSKKTRAAVVLKNLSVSPSVELPSALLLGLSGELFSDLQNRLTGAISLNQQLEGGVKFNFGLEYGFSELFILRAGYEHDP
ncbi:MAG TPA: hypothetical protein P5511_07815, partial [Candidatus Goldiibacteriota bacterium]|nr:hypothetical protein [Candidatus Goldiibacteriota bacterium]